MLCLSTSSGKHLSPIASSDTHSSRPFSQSSCSSNLYHQSDTCHFGLTKEASCQSQCQWHLSASNNNACDHSKLLNVPPLCRTCKAPAICEAHLRASLCNLLSKWPCALRSRLSFANISQHHAASALAKLSTPVSGTTPLKQ